MSAKKNVESLVGPKRGLELWRRVLEDYGSQAYSVAQGGAIIFTTQTQTKDNGTLDKDLDTWIEIGMVIENTGTEFNFTPQQKSFALTLLVHDDLRK